MRCHNPFRPFLSLFFLVTPETLTSSKALRLLDAMLLTIVSVLVVAVDIAYQCCYYSCRWVIVVLRGFGCLVFCVVSNLLLCYMQCTYTCSYRITKEKSKIVGTLAFFTSSCYVPWHCGSVFVLVLLQVPKSFVLLVLYSFIPIVVDV